MADGFCYAPRAVMLAFVTPENGSLCVIGQVIGAYSSAIRRSSSPWPAPAESGFANSRCTNGIRSATALGPAPSLAGLASATAKRRLGSHPICDATTAAICQSPRRSSAPDPNQRWHYGQPRNTARFSICWRSVLRINHRPEVGSSLPWRDPDLTWIVWSGAFLLIIGGALRRFRRWCLPPDQ